MLFSVIHCSWYTDAFCSVFSLFQSGMIPWSLCTSEPCCFCIIVWYGTLVFCVQNWSPLLLNVPVVCCYVCPGLGLNSMEDLGVEEMLNGIDKYSAERNLTKR